MTDRIDKMLTSTHYARLLENAGENMIVTDQTYPLVFIIRQVVGLLSKYPNLSEELELPKNLPGSQKTRLNFMDAFVADLIFNPMKEEERVFAMFFC